MPIAYPYKFSDWYGYDKDCAELFLKYGTPTSVSKPVVACGVAASAARYFTAANVGEYVYTDAEGTTPLGAGNWGYGETLNQAAASRFTTLSTGYITVFTPC